MKNRDNLHFSWNHALSYDKPWNFVFSERENGKSVDSWIHIFNAYYYHNQPSIVLRRMIADITDAYIMDTQSLLNKFLEEPIQLLYKKGTIKDGIVDVKIGEYGKEYSWQAVDKLPIFFRVIGLSNPMNRIKSLMLPNLRYFFFDEFCANTRGGEKYLKDEFFRIQEIYTTYKRETKKLTILGAANPYSVYNPIFSGLGVNTANLKPGAFIVGPNYVIDCYETKPELKAYILAHNPMYEFDDSYKKYAFSGEAKNDANIKIHKAEPKGFKLKFVFKLGDECISVHQRSSRSLKEMKDKFWICKHKKGWIEKISSKRPIIVFNFADMCDGAFIPANFYRETFTALKYALMNRQVIFNTVDASYMMEDVFTFI